MSSERSSICEPISDLHVCARGCQSNGYMRNSAEKWMPLSKNAYHGSNIMTSPNTVTIGIGNLSGIPIIRSKSLLFQDGNAMDRIQSTIDRVPLIPPEVKLITQGTYVHKASSERMAKKPAHFLEVPQYTPTQNDVSEELAERCWLADETWMPVESMTIWLAGTEPIQCKTRKFFMDRLDLAKKSVLKALRELSLHLYLQAETNQIDTLLQALSERYCECNPDTLFSNQAMVHNVMFSLFLLNTDLHIADMHTKMTLQQFISNTFSTLQEENVSLEGSNLHWHEIMETLSSFYHDLKANRLETIFPYTTQNEKKISALKRNSSIRYSTKFLNLASRDQDPKELVVRRASKRWVRNSLRKTEESDMSEIIHNTPYTPCSSSQTYFPTAFTHSVECDPNKVWTRPDSQCQYTVYLTDNFIYLQQVDPISCGHDKPMCMNLVHSYADIQCEEKYASLRLHLNDASIHSLHGPIQAVLALYDIFNSMAAKCTKVMHLPEYCDVEYGWQHIPSEKMNDKTHLGIFNLVGKFIRRNKRSAFIQDWEPPYKDLRPNDLSETEQLENMNEYLKCLECEIQIHLGLRQSMVHYWRSSIELKEKAVSNWESYYSYLLTQQHQFRLYQHALQSALV